MSRHQASGLEVLLGLLFSAAAGIVAAGAFIYRIYTQRLDTEPTENSQGSDQP
jgi:hypothetical protein